MFGYRNSKYDAAPVNFYREAKQRYEEVKPIRGRSGDVRPIGKRSRDHECIVKVSDTAYAIRLYGTNVVTYHEDGSVELCTGGYPSVSTAEMIELHGPFYTAKRSRNVWAWNRYESKDENLKAEKYVIPADGTPVKFVRRDGRYVPETPQVIQQRVVDRTGIKELRARIKPFLDYAKVMLNLSGGWLHLNTMFDLGGEKLNTYVHGQIIFPKNFTREQGALMNNVGYRTSRNDARDFVQMILDCGEDHDQWMRIVYLLLSRFTDAVERDFAFTETHECGTHQRPCNYYNGRYTVKQFMDLIGRILRQHPDAQTVQEISPNKKFHTNVV